MSGCLFRRSGRASAGPRRRAANFQPIHECAPRPTWSPTHACVSFERPSSTRTLWRCRSLYRTIVIWLACFHQRQKRTEMGNRSFKGRFVLAFGSTTFLSALLFGACSGGNDGADDGGADNGDDPGGQGGTA